MYKHISSLPSVISQIYHHGQCWQVMCPQVESSSPTRCEPRATSPCSTLCRSVASFREALKSWFPNLFSYAHGSCLRHERKANSSDSGPRNAWQNYISPLYLDICKNSQLRTNTDPEWEVFSSCPLSVERSSGPLASSPHLVSPLQAISVLRPVHW